MGQFLKAFPRSKTFPNPMSVNHPSSHDDSNNDDNGDNTRSASTDVGTHAELAIDLGLGLDEGRINPRLLRRARAIQRELLLANHHNNDSINNTDATTPVPCVLSALGKTLFGLDVLETA